MRCAIRLTVALLALAVPAAEAQVTPTDDARFRLQQEQGRIEQARENARIERERAGFAAPAPPAGARSDPAAALDRMRGLDRMRDERSRIEGAEDRIRDELRRLERERTFGQPGP